METKILSYPPQDGGFLLVPMLEEDLYYRETDEEIAIGICIPLHLTQNLTVPRILALSSPKKDLRRSPYDTGQLLRYVQDALKLHWVTSAKEHIPGTLGNPKQIFEMLKYALLVDQGPAVLNLCYAAYTQMCQEKHIYSTGLERTVMDC